MLLTLGIEPRISSLLVMRYTTKPCERGLNVFSQVCFFIVWSRSSRGSGRDWVNSRTTEESLGADGQFIGLAV